VFPSGDQTGLLWLHAHQPPTPLSELRPDLPSELAVLVGDLLAKSPADRPTTAGEVRARLGRLSGLDGQPRRPDGPSVRISRHAATGVPPTRPWSGTAPVVTRTRTMPALEHDEQAAARPGFHLGPAGIVTVAVSAAIIAAVAVALAMAPWQGFGSAAPGTDVPAGVTSATEPTAIQTAAGTVDAVRAAVAAQVVTGQLDPRQAGDLDRDLDAIERHLARGDARRAADRIDELRHRVDELRSDDRLTDTGHAAIMASIDQLAATLPEGDDDDD
jgi:serine/threonine-protein kinase